MELHSTKGFGGGLQAKAQKDVKLGLYVHVPFCASTCDFCAFYQETPHRKQLLNFLSSVEHEFLTFATNRPLETVFWGGGTPGLLTASDLERLGRSQIDTFGHPIREWTIELAPSTVKPDKLKVLRDIGVNRISLGVQSFQDSMLESLGRRQSAKQALEAFEMIRDAGFENVNIDLIFAVPGQTMELWIRDLDKVAELAPEHISTYCLTFEEDTALYTKLSQGHIVQDVEREAEFYLRTWELLETMDFQQYEVSNFARADMACIHNVNTWRMQEWLGFGPSAASQFGNRRFTNDANLENWMTGITEGVPSRVEDEELSLQELALDCLIFGLRMNEDIDLGEIGARFPDFIFSRAESFLQGLVSDGLASLQGRRYSLTLDGRLVVDRIGSELMETQVQVP